MLPRTERQAEVLRFITSYTTKRGVAPSYGAIGRHIGVRSRATVAKHIRALEKRGLLTRKGDIREGTFELKFRAVAIQCPHCNHKFLHEYNMDS